MNIECITHDKKRQLFFYSEFVVVVATRQVK